AKLKNFEDKLFFVIEAVGEIWKEFSPEQLVLEEAFVGKIIQSTLRLADIRGALTYFAQKKEARESHFSTRKVKKSITGNANASKFEVANFLKQDFSIEQQLPEDVSDALALAYHFYLSRKQI